LPGPVFKQGVLTMDDIAPGMELRGTVLNVVDFGAFVDVGLKDSGLVHISRMSTGFVRSPHDIVSLGDVITVWVQDIDRERRRLSLTMVPPGAPPRGGGAPAPHPARDGADPAASDRPPRADAHHAKSTAKAEPAAGASVSAGQKAGKEPLRGFDELKQLWRERQ
jgi:uncharacterized protein